VVRGTLGLKTAEGMRDLLPRDLRRLEEMERRALDLFAQWSYQKVLTTGLEYGACVEPDITQSGTLYKFFDKEGQVLALRPEFTTPIARLVATRLKGEQLPLRLCYSGDVYRNTAIRHREFRQVGAELIGSEADLADAEIIALAIEMIHGLNVSDFRVSLGHMDVFSGLADELSLGEKLRADLEDGLARKDIVKMERVIAASGLPEKAAEFLRLLPHLTGGEDVLVKLDQYNTFKSVRRASESLRTIYRYLCDFGAEKNVLIDLGILRGFTYYTGIIFEGYVPQIGFPALEGGRYDKLYRDFGLKYPATGFAFNLEALLDVQQTEPRAESADVFVYGQSPGQVILRCQELRREGRKVEMALGYMSEGQARRRASSQRIPLVEKVEG